MVQIVETPVLQWIGVTCGVIQVLLAKSNKVLLYPFGIVSVSITMYVLYEVGLYAELALNGYYLVMSIYGWALWSRSRNQAPVLASYSGKRDWVYALSIVVLAFPILYFALVQFTDSTVPVWDSWVSATAWAGMWLLAKRKIENWILLNISNAFAIPLLAYKGLHLYAVLTLFLFVVAVFGYFEWRKVIARQQTDGIGKTRSVALKS